MRTATATIAERSFELPATAAAAAIARRELASTPGVAGELGYRALLLTTELIAVFVADAEPRPHERLAITAGPTASGLRVTVAGQAPAVSPGALLRSRETPSLGGYGLRLVERTAARWGAAEDGGRLTLWFELAR